MALSCSNINAQCAKHMWDDECDYHCATSKYRVLLSIMNRLGTLKCLSNLDKTFNKAQRNRRVDMNGWKEKIALDIAQIRNFSACQEFPTSEKSQFWLSSPPHLHLSSGNEAMADTSPEDERSATFDNRCEYDV